MSDKELASAIGEPQHEGYWWCVEEDGGAQEVYYAAFVDALCLPEAIRAASLTRQAAASHRRATQPPKPTAAEAAHLTERKRRMQGNVFSAFGKLMRAKRTLYNTKIVDLGSLFDAIDKDGEDGISHAEFKEAMKRLGLGLSDSDITALLGDIDTDGSGSIERQEFMHVCCFGMLRTGLAARLRTLFVCIALPKRHSIRGKCHMTLR